MKKIIRNTGALDNDLFRNCANAKNVPIEKLLQYARNWYEITKVFGLHSTSFLGVVARELEKEKGSTIFLKSFLQDSALIVTDDLGLYRGASDNFRGPIHFDLFLKMLESTLTTSITPKIFEYELEEATKMLSWRIKRNFKKINGGLANFCVVETIAENIVRSQLRLFLGTVNKKQKAIFKEENLTYITLHIDLENHHADESSVMYKKYVKHLDENKLHNEIAALSGDFFNFFRRMHQIIFLED